MARAKTATTEKPAREIDDHPTMFPELDPKKPAEKELAKLLRRYRDDKRTHAEAMESAHEDMIDSRNAARAKMHEIGVERVQLDGEIFELRPGDEKIAIKKAKPAKAEDNGNGDDSEDD